MLFKKLYCVKLNLLLIRSYKFFFMNLTWINYNICLIIFNELFECCVQRNKILIFKH